MAENVVFGGFLARDNVAVCRWIASIDFPLPTAQPAASLIGEVLCDLNVPFALRSKCTEAAKVYPGLGNKILF